MMELQQDLICDENKNTSLTCTVTLPEEVLAKIFEYLEAEDLCVTSLVCKNWNRIASDISLWQILYTKRWKKKLTNPENAKKMFIREFYRYLKQKQSKGQPYTVKIDAKKKK